MHHAAIQEDIKVKDNNELRGEVEVVEFVRKFVRLNKGDQEKLVREMAEAIESSAQEVERKALDSQESQR